VVGLTIMLMQVRVYGDSHPHKVLAEKGKDTIAQRGDADRAEIAHEQDLYDSHFALVKPVERSSYEG